MRASLRIASILPLALVLLPSLAGCARRGGAAIEAGRPVVLITIDTLRPDHLGAYGYTRPTSPNLDAFARTALRFTNVVAQWPATSPSMAAMFTSSYVHTNGMPRKTGDFYLADDAETLAELLKASGYQTVYVTANGALGIEFNFNQGFDHVGEPWRWRPGPDIESSVAADRTTDLAIELLAGIDVSKPFFFWVHYIDPHAPYSPPEPFASRFKPDPTAVAGGPRLLCRTIGNPSGAVEDPAGECTRAGTVARYDAEIAFTDFELGRLLKVLGERGALDRALTIVSADHGEALGEEHNFFGHSRSVRQSEIRVPLLIRLPGSAAMGRTEAAPVELVDIAPTVLALTGHKRGARMQGDDLSGLVLGLAEAYRPTYSFSEAGFHRSYMRTVLTHRHKFIHVPDSTERRFMAGPYYELYDLVADPLETTNLADANPALVQRLLARVEAWRASDFGYNAVAAKPGAPPVSSETQEQLRALGYLN